MTQFKTKMVITYCLFFSAVVLLLGAPVYGKNDHVDGEQKMHGKSKASKEPNMKLKHQVKLKDNKHVAFSEKTREDVIHYLQSYAKDEKQCPPGLAKKNPLCMPPGHYKQYSIGSPLPEDIIWSSLPLDLLRLLPPKPANAYYGIVDHDILLISAEDRLVLDAISLLSR